MKVLLLLLSVIAVTVYAIPHKSEQQFIDGQYLIRVDEQDIRTPEQEESFIAVLERQYHVYVVKTFHAASLTLFFVKGEASNVDKVRSLPSIKYIQQNQIFTLDACTETPAPGVYGLDRIDQREALGYSSPSNPDATYTWGEDTGTGSVVYVADTGIDWEHPDFGGRARFGFSVYDNEDDGHGHGTHCAGSVGSNSYGIARGADLVAVKVLSDFGSGTTTRIIEGLEWIKNDHIARSGGDMAKSVVSMSIGGGRDQAYEDYVDSLIEAGISVVVSAGNSDDDACKQAPAVVPRAITVAATDVNDVSAYFTNFGSCVDISAPGVSVLSTAPGGGTAIMSGTSMSTPYVAGVVARYQSSQADTPTPAEVDTWLKDASTKDAITWYRSQHGESPNYLVYGGCPIV